MPTLFTILGTRPEIIKLSPILPLLDARYDHRLMHTGQHYDHALDRVFFDELHLRPPDVRLDVGSGSHGAQTARMLSALEPLMLHEQPDAVLVQGDTNSTFAGAITASKLGIPVIHLEAGCRSFNRHMPEEINRVLVDHCADVLLAADDQAVQQLRDEGIAADQIHHVGSTAIDACLRSVRFANRSAILQRLGLQSRDYLLLTIHRAENTAPDVLPGIVAALDQIGQKHTVVVPLHPRTVAAMRAQELRFAPHVRVIEPLGYLDLLQLLRHATAILTDSGGLQEEAAALNVPLLIVRHETEWDYLVRGGKAVLIGNQFDTMLAGCVHTLHPDALVTMRRRPCITAGGAAQRIVDVIEGWLGAQEDRHARTFIPARKAVALNA